MLPSESSSEVTRSSFLLWSRGCSSGFNSSLSGGVIGGACYVGHGTPPQQSLERDDMDRSQSNLNRGNFHNWIWWCRFIFDGILLSCLERYSDHFADTRERILGVLLGNYPCLDENDLRCSSRFFCAYGVGLRHCENDCSHLH